MTDLNLEELKKAAQNATPGQWSWDNRMTDDGNHWEVVDAHNTAIASNDDGWVSDAEHIAAFDPPTALALIARIEAAELWSTVHPCNVTHEEPYDFQWCETHDRTFPLDGACDHEGLSAIDYQNKRETEQRVRAISAEDRIEEFEAAIQRVRDLHWETLGECAACSLDSSAPYPCPTIKALEGDPK